MKKIQNQENTKGFFLHMDDQSALNLHLWEQELSFVLQKKEMHS